MTACVELCPLPPSALAHLTLLLFSASDCVCLWQYLFHVCTLTCLLCMQLCHSRLNFILQPVPNVICLGTVLAGDQALPPGLAHLPSGDTPTHVPFPPAPLSTAPGVSRLREAMPFRPKRLSCGFQCLFIPHHPHLWIKGEGLIGRLHMSS